MRAALIYQRATSDADERIAERLSQLAKEHRQAEEADGGGDDEGVRKRWNMGE